MTPAKYESIQAVGEIGNLTFKATGQKQVFPGFQILKGLDEADGIQDIQSLIKGNLYNVKTADALQHFTQPPARYSEASLIKKLELIGVGRPSTYSSIISTIMTRTYVEKVEKYLMPTDIGIAVSHLLTDNFSQVVDYDFTSEMENQLDLIADGKTDWLKFLKDFYFPFEQNIAETEGKISRDDYKLLGKAPEEIKCPTCGSEMLIKLGRYGRFYSCSKWPDCKGILSITGESQEDLQKEVTTDAFVTMYLPSPKTDDGRDFSLKQGKFGKFWAHPDYPKVKDARPLELQPEEIVRQFGKPPKDEEGTTYVLRSGKFGKYWAHPDYPKVKKIIKIPKK
jgi:DNA topoisomerase-1